LTMSKSIEGEVKQKGNGGKREAMGAGKPEGTGLEHVRI